MKKATSTQDEHQLQALFDHNPHAICLFDQDGRFQKVNPAGQACSGRTLTDPLSAIRKGEVAELYRSLFENNSNAVAACDLFGRVTTANQAYLDLLGYSLEEVVGKHVLELVPNDRLEEISGRMRECAQGRPQYFESQVVTKHGRVLDIEMDKLPIRVKGEIIGLYTIVRDITEKKRAEALIHHMAYYDPLTDLPNRVLFRKRLTEALAKEPVRCAVLFLDLDQFKIVNDTLGHSAGDEMLKAVSKRISACLGPGDTLSRIGGDEFMILLPDLSDTVKVQQAARRIIEGLKEPFELAGRLFYMTCSIGIVLAPEHGDNPELLLQHADTAMYFAKDQGKNTYSLFHSHMSRSMSRRIELEGALRKAIGDEAFSLHYQPQIEAATGRVYGAEALVRWITPERTLSPAEFIPLAEETGLIVELGAWVLRSACLQAKAWREQGVSGLRVSVNLSSRQFQDPYFLQKVGAILRETGADPDWIGLEITESLIMGNVAHATQTLRELRNMGFEISIDDFGTGYSSLAYLKAFPIHKLKIDQQFVRDVATNEEDRAIVKAIIALAKILGLHVVAEGVETAEHARLLREEGCDELQGYFFSKPLPASEFEGYLRTVM